MFMLINLMILLINTIIHIIAQLKLIKSNTYIDSGKEINEKDPKFKIGDNVRISKYKKEFKIEKVIKKKDDKLYVKWKGYDNSFNTWIDKKIYYK